MKLSTWDTLTDIGVIKSSKEVSGESENGKAGLTMLSSEGESLPPTGSMKNKLEGTPIFTDMEYIKGPDRKVIVVNNKPTRGERKYEDIKG